MKSAFPISAFPLHSAAFFLSTIFEQKVTCVSTNSDSSFTCDLTTAVFIPSKKKRNFCSLLGINCQARLLTSIRHYWCVLLADTCLVSWVTVLCCDPPILGGCLSMKTGSTNVLWFVPCLWLILNRAVARMIVGGCNKQCLYWHMLLFSTVICIRLHVISI